MKKVIKIASLIGVIIISCVIGSVNAFATADRFEGMTNREINKTLMEEMMKESEGVDIYAFDKDELKVQEIAKKSGLHRNQITELLGKGYTEKDICTIDSDKADEILTKGMSDDELAMYYTHIAHKHPSNENDFILKSSRGYCSICGYTPDGSVNWTHIDATSGYNASGCFHENSGLTSSNVNTACYRAKMAGFNIFDLTSSSNLNFDYYMFGENYGSAHPDWAHEGVDLNYTGTNGRDVYAPITGHVHRINSSTIVIHPTSGSYSVNVQHLDNAIADGSTVIKGETKIGNEGTGSGENHIHLGVCTHNGANCTTIHTQQDLTLRCVPPYTYID